MLGTDTDPSAGAVLSCASHKDLRDEALEHLPLRKVKRERGRSNPAPRQIFRDRELQSFIEDCFTRSLTYAEIHTECLARFEKERVPSSGTIGRYFRAPRRLDDSDSA